jgi:hypothetical protein
MKRQAVRSIVPALFAIALTMATWPAWRLLFLSSEPTLEELLQMICSRPI